MSQKTLLVVVTFLGCSLVSSTSAFAEEERQAAEARLRVERPNSIYLELGGRGLVDGLYYERTLLPLVSLGAGFGYWPESASSSTSINGMTIESSSSSTQAFPVSLYGNIYASEAATTVFLSAGAMYLLVNGGSNSLMLSESFHPTGNTVIPQVGVGFESRSMNGFTFKLTFYGFFGSKAFTPWAGVGFGWSF